MSKPDGGSSSGFARDRRLSRALVVTHGASPISNCRSARENRPTKRPALPRAFCSYFPLVWGWRAEIRFA
jgi:hypothetical protein